MTRGKMGIFGGAAVLVLSAAIGFGQVQDYPSQPAPPAPQPADQGPPQLLSGPQLDNLIAPVALYPDPLLGQVLAASTYPLEIVELGQWLQQNKNLSGQQLIDAAKQMNWDPSVQALVAFPDAVTMLTRDIRWTTDLGNAFLTQQADVMNAVQRMRAAARNNGRLNSGPQQTVTTETQDGQTAIQIQPADPQIVYVPTYNPAYVWGPPIWGAYPPLYYPPIGYGFGFGYPCYLGGFFGGFLGFGGWGWGLGWFGHGLFVNGLFFNHYGFHGYGYGGFGARGAWAHNPAHRLGVSYPNRVVASRYNSGAFRGAAANRGAAAGGWRSFNRGSGTTARAGAGAGAYRGNSNYSSNYRGGAAAGNRGYSNAAPRGNAGQSYHNGPAAQSYGRSPGASSQGFRGGQSFAARPQSSAPRYSAPSQRYSAPSQHYSAPSQHFSAPRSSGGFSGGGRSSGGFSGSRSSGGGGGHSSGGGGHSGGGHSGGGRR